MVDYTQKGHYYISEPRFEVKKFANFLPSQAHVLDIGAGYGNNTVYLLNLGHKVTALEPNPAAIPTLKKLQKSYPDQLNVIQGSLGGLSAKANYDGIVCCMVLHFLNNAKAGATAIRKIQELTKPGGYNLVTSYVQKQELPPEYSWLIAPGELSTFYSDWGVRWQEVSYRLAWSRIAGPADALRLVSGRKGFKAARIITQKTQ